MDKPFFQTSLRSCVWLGGQSYQTLLKDVGLERFEASNNDIDPQIVLVTSEQVRFGDIFRHQVALSFGNRVLFADDLDTFSATCACWLEYVHVLEIIHFSVIDPSFVIFRENICYRTYFKIFSVLSSLFLNISPEVGFASKSPGTGKMIDFLMWVHIS